MNSDKPEVSIIVPIYNHHAYIKNALLSILDQKTNFLFEIIISNDASTDSSHKVILEILKDINNDFRIRYYNQPKNLGMINNAKFLLKSAKGKYIAICEGDDYWIDSNKLQMQYDFMENNFQCKLCVTNALYYYEEKNKFKKFKTPNRYINKKNLSIDLVYLFSPKRVILPTASFFFRKCEIFDSQLLELAKYINVGDRCIILRALMEGDVCCLPTITAVYRVIFKGKSWTSLNINHIIPNRIESEFVKRNYVYKEIFQNKFNTYRKYDDSALIATEISKNGRVHGKHKQIKLFFKYYKKLTRIDLLYVIPRILFKW